MAEKHGIEETKEALVATYAVGKFVIERLKDGAQFDDAMALGLKLMEPQFRELVMKGVDGADKVPSEIKDLSAKESLELAKAVIDMIEAA